MQLTTILTIASAAVAASATMYEVAPMGLMKRQGGDSFRPGTTYVFFPSMKYTKYSRHLLNILT